jgi:flagellar motor switch protein FliM
MTAALGGTEIEAVALLGDYVSTVREVLGLRVGDIVRLSTTPDEPLVIRVGDKAVARGMPVVHHGNIAVQIQALESAAA